MLYSFYGLMVIKYIESTGLADARLYDLWAVLLYTVQVHHYAQLIGLQDLTVPLAAACPPVILEEINEIT